MTYEDLATVVNQRPFVPFRIHLTTGTMYDIRHPELFMLGRRAVVVGLAASQTQTFFDTATTIDIFHIVRTEPISPPTPLNGAPPVGAAKQ